MDPQPDIEKLSGAFDAIGRLTTSVDGLTTQVNTLRTDVNTLRTEVNTLRTDVNTLRTDVNTRFDSLELRMRAESAYFSPFSSSIMITFYSAQNHMARLYNSHISSRDTPLRALYDQRHMVVPGFPNSPATLMRLTG